ncbi:MAG: GntR family transcriptional regulator [Oscillospiraceae bacterium]|nr:GntR family transcriptional regulator [Oscillospiraceae bacterium]
MVSFERFTMEDGSPIYQQIVLYLKREAVAGRVMDGDELPSRRVLSALLGVNPNTVQKSYRILEEEGLIQSHSGAKSYMVLSGQKLSRVTAELLESEAKAAVRTLKQMGISKEEAMALFSRYWE